MSTGSTLNDFLKTLPADTSGSGKNLLVYDDNGNPLGKTIEKTVLNEICLKLFALPLGYNFRQNRTDISPSAMKSWVNKNKDSYSACTAARCPADTICVADYGMFVIFLLALDEETTTGVRYVKPLMGVYKGYAPYWNPNAAIP